MDKSKKKRNVSFDDGRNEGEERRGREKSNGKGGKSREKSRHAFSSEKYICIDNYCNLICTLTY